MTIIPTFIRNFGAFTSACLITYIFGTLFVTQININSVTDLGVTVSLPQRLSSAISDLVNMLPTLWFTYSRGVINSFTIYSIAVNTLYSI